MHVHSERALGGIRPFDIRRIASWRAHLGRVRSEYDANKTAFQQGLIRFGYELDDNWAACLTEVKPSGKSYKDAGERWLKKVEVDLRYWFKTNRYLRAH